MFKIEDGIIHCTRGDKGNINFSCPTGDGTNYIFQNGQIIIFKVYDPKDVENILIQKEVTIENDCSFVLIPLTSEDTTIGEYITKKKEYAYEISINDDMTVIGYDEDGAKPFILYPEAGKKQTGGDVA